MIQEFFCKNRDIEACEVIVFILLNVILLSIYVRAFSFLLIFILSLRLFFVKQSVCFCLLIITKLATVALLVLFSCIQIMLLLIDWQFAPFRSQKLRDLCEC